MALSGGTFQNRLLAARTMTLLGRQGLETIRNRQVPPNEGGIALGQLAVAGARLSG